MMPARRRRKHEIADAGAVRGVDRDRQTRKLVVEGGDTAEIEGVARVAVAARDPALAEDHVLLAERHHALDPQEIRLGVERVAALVDDRQRGVAQAIQQRLVLAVRLADLQAVHAGVLVDRHVGGIEDLDHRRQAELASRPHDQLEAAPQRLVIRRAETFPAAVRARAILDHAAAQAARTRLPHHARGFHDLRLALDRARSGDDHEVVAAAGDVADLDLRMDAIERVALLRRALVGARDGDQRSTPGSCSISPCGKREMSP